MGSYPAHRLLALARLFSLPARIGLTPNLSEGLFRDDTGSSRVLSKGVAGHELVQLRRRLGVRRHDESPVTVVVTLIFQEHGLGSVKQEYAAEHIMMADVLEKIRSSAIVPDRQAKMVIVKTHVFGQIGLCPGERKNA